MSDSQDEQDTIVAIATPPGRGAIGIIRLSGPQAISIAARLFRGRDPQTMPAFSAAHGFVEEGGERLDEALCLVMRKPRSYTGEDVVEFHCHGGPVPLRRVMAAVIRAGARPAGPGEFTRRAFLAGKIDLAQAEAVADLIASETEQAARSALAQLTGALSSRLSGLKNNLVVILARLEAQIDFPEEEDVVIVEPTELAEKLQAAEREMEELIRQAEQGRRFREGARVVIAGRPNVGKSTLMNALLARDRVIVSPFPGTTRDVVEDVIDIEGIPVRLFDTAGLGEAHDPVEKIGVTRARETIHHSDLVLFVLDASSTLTEEDRQLAKELPRPALFVMNKCDLPVVMREEEARALAGSSPLISISALTGAGLNQLKEVMAEILLGAPAGVDYALMTNARHLDALLRSRTSLTNALLGLRQELSTEFIASDLRQSLLALAEITGETTPEEILDLIFSRFCIGK